MKNLRLSFVVLFVLFLFSTALPESPIKSSTKLSENSINAILNGINSDNYGLRTSAAFVAGEVKCDKAVLPLLAMLKSDTSNKARIVAAVSLYKLGDSRGMYIIKKLAKNEDCTELRKVCNDIIKDNYRKTKM